VADLVILAENAEQVAMGQKYCPRPSCADKGTFFAKMRAVAGDNSPGPGPADPFFIGQPVNFTLVRADTARRQPLPGLRNAAGQFSLCMKGKISGLYHFFFSISMQKSYIAKRHLQNLVFCKQLC
jgi:hypothetical protein